MHHESDSDRQVVSDRVVRRDENAGTNEVRRGRQSEARSAKELVTESLRVRHEISEVLQVLTKFSRRKK